MSSSPARLAANAANAQHSTGPRTPEGQARSSQNARTHGLTARDLIIRPDEREEFDEWLSRYQTDVAPQDSVQLTLFDELVAAAWNLRRTRRMETILCANISYEDLLNDDEIQKKLDRLARYKVSIERTFHRCLKEIKALQTSSFFKATLSKTVRPHVPPLSNAAQIAKRTQELERSDSLRMFKEYLEAPPPVSRAESFRAAGFSGEGGGSL